MDLSEGALARRLLSLLDLTSLDERDDASTVRALASVAVTPFGHVAALCILPDFVAVAKEALRDTPVKIATVCNFPSGRGQVETVCAEAASVVAAGADEVDVVLAYHALRSGDCATPLRLVRACRAACGEKALLKVILECGQLEPDALLREAAQIAIEGGADFLKTSTGKTSPGPTAHTVGVMLEALQSARRRGVSVGLKVSGGVGTVDQARNYLALYEDRFGAGSATAESFRIGSSALITPLLAMLRGAMPS
jgi:deoxyribose-phosphate aldolase